MDRSRSVGVRPVHSITILGNRRHIAEWLIWRIMLQDIAL